MGNPTHRILLKTQCKIQNIALNFINPNTNLYSFTLKKNYLDKLRGKILRISNENTIMYLVGDRISTSHKNMRLTQLFLENMKQKQFITLQTTIILSC